jgi:hypothetical protein
MRTLVVVAVLEDIEALLLLQDVRPGPDEWLPSSA